MNRFFSASMKVLLWGALPVALAVATALLLLMNRLDEEIRAEVQRKFAAHYANLHVSVRSAHRVEGQGISIRGLSIKDPRLEGPQGELLYIDEIFLKCLTDVDRVISGDVAVRHVALRRMALRAVRQEDGSWTVARLMPLPKFGDDSPSATIEGATVEVFDPHRHPPAVLTLRDIHMSVVPMTDPAMTASAAAAGASPQGVLQVEGTLSSSHFQEIQAVGWLDPQTALWEVRGRAKHVVISPESRQTLPGVLSEQTAALGDLRGLAELEFQVRSDPTGEIPYAFNVVGNLHDGTLRDARLPYPLTDVKFNVTLNNQGLNITDLTATSGQASVELSLNRQGWKPESPLQLTARARRLQLDRNLAEALPTDLRPLWYQYLPEGLFDADVTLNFDGQTWKPELLVRCLDVSLLYHRFPYPLTQTTGVVQLKDDVLAFHLRGLAGTQGVRVDGQLSNLAKSPLGWVEIETEDPLPIDGKLISALDTPQLSSLKQIVTNLNARGNFTCFARLQRETIDEPEFRRSAVLRFSNGSIEYSLFPYPLQRIHGAIEINDGQMVFRDFEGRNDSGYVTCKGSYTTQNEESLLSLDFIGTDIPLEDELRDALSPRARRLWSDLRPQGTIDHVGVQVRYQPVKSQLDLRVAAQKWPAEQNVEGRTMSLLPKAFPYRFNHVIGSLSYDNGQVTFTDVRAVHGRSELATSGYCELLDDGGWRFVLSPVTADRVAIDRDLISALPEKLATAVTTLNLSGPIDVSGAVEFRGSPDPRVGVATSWDLAVEVENAFIGCGVPLEHIYGGVRLIGTSDDKGFYSRGELSVDSLMYSGFQLTQVAGPIWIDAKRVAFGAWAEEQKPNVPPRHISAMLLGGAVQSDIYLSLERERKFNVQARLEAADLSQLSREMLPRQREVTGLVSGQLRLEGNCQGRDTLVGDGKVWLRDADIYQLPVMVSLLKILSVRKPDQTAFTTSDIDFRIAGEHVYFDRMVFSGDAISLRGNGEVGFNREVNLKFYTLVGRDSLWIPLVQPLLAEAGRRMLMIEVTGTLDNPVTTRNVLPGLNDTFQHLFNDDLQSMTAPGPRGPVR